MRPSVEISAARATRRMHCWAIQQWHPRRAQANARQKKFGRRGSPRVGEAVLDWKKRLVASVRGTWSHDAAGQHRLILQPGEVVRSTLPPSPARPIDAASPIRHPNCRFYRPARVSRENTRDQRRARPGRVAEATSTPRSKKKPRRALTPRSTAMKSTYDALSESAEHDCPRTSGLISRSVFWKMDSLGQLQARATGWPRQLVVVVPRAQEEARRRCVFAGRLDFLLSPAAAASSKRCSRSSRPAANKTAPSSSTSPTQLKPISPAPTAPHSSPGRERLRFAA